jgi:hypothetical protein
MEMSLFAWNMGMSFFGMPSYILDVCPENWDESNGNSIVKLWLQFIPIFGALHSQLRKGHTKKRHPHVPHMHRSGPDNRDLIDGDYDNIIKLQ